MALRPTKAEQDLRSGGVAPESGAVVDVEGDQRAVLAPGGQLTQQAQAVGVSVSGDREIAERTVVEHQELLFRPGSAPHDAVAALSEVA